MRGDEVFLRVPKDFLGFRLPFFYALKLTKTLQCFYPVRVVLRQRFFSSANFSASAKLYLHGICMPYTFVSIKAKHPPQQRLRNENDFAQWINTRRSLGEGG